MDFVRDYAMYMAIFGVFGSSWFGWAQEKPRESWRKYLGIASVFSLLLGLIGIYLSVTNWHEPSALSEAGAFKSYLIYLFAEFIVAGIGSFLLIKNKRKDYVASWVAFIVGIHFIGLKSIFQDSTLYLLATLLIVISIISVFLSKKLKVANSAITGIGAGIILFCFAILGLIRFIMA
ncbi:hypothetical protein ACQKM9_04555 [Viridibacillus sp. NPDC093762]|uniref:hypothetical protein n=1 Tax=Viridibacillus sp. NPDC093762 TaxID=3390720 RepID=UPI003D021421